MCILTDKQRCHVRTYKINFTKQMYVHVILFVWSKGVVNISGQVDADVGYLQDGLINVYQPMY